MSPDALHMLLTSRFCETLGGPDHASGCETPPLLHLLHGANSVSVVVSGRHYQAVWSFDPRTPRAPVHGWPVAHHARVEEVIDLITASAREQQQFDRGALDLLHAVRYSNLHGSHSPSDRPTTARNAADGACRLDKGRPRPNRQRRRRSPRIHGLPRGSSA